MNEPYKELKKKYDEIDKQIRELHIEQRKIRNQMKEVCTHENLVIVESDPFLTDIGVEDEDTRYKCRDCFEYFNESEVNAMIKEAYKRI